MIVGPGSGAPPQVMDADRFDWLHSECGVRSAECECRVPLGAARLGTVARPRAADSRVRLSVAELRAATIAAGTPPDGADRFDSGSSSRPAAAGATAPGRPRAPTSSTSPPDRKRAAAGARRGVE